MAREPGRLTALAVARAKKPGLYSDGGGLNLQIGPSGARSWIFRYQKSGRRRYMEVTRVAPTEPVDTDGEETVAAQTPVEETPKPPEQTPADASQS